METLAIDRLVNSFGHLVTASSHVLRRLQNGSIGFYIFVMVLSIIVILTLSTVAELEDDMILLFLILWPLVTALGIYAFQPANAKVVAFVSSLIEFFVLLFLLIHFDSRDPGVWTYHIAWIPSLGINFIVGVDGISLLLVLLTTGLVPFIILSSFKMPKQKSPNFYALVLIMQMALVGVFTALDGFLFYVFWEMALIPIYFICLIWGDENKVRVTFKFFVYTLAGSLFMLIALLFLYYQTPGNHSFDIQALYNAGRALSAFQQGIIFWGLFLAFAIKMPIFPFHTWQPDTYTVAPMEGTMLLSGIMLKMGFYGLIRWLMPIVPLGVKEWGFTRGHAFGNRNRICIRYRNQPKGF